MQPKVSIIVPVYNVEKYFKRCMNSLLKQTIEEIEIILVNDGSPDNCPIMCDEYAEIDPRVKVIHKKNAGLGFARNSGIEVAAGEYIAFVDSDDYVDTNMYQTLYNYAAKSNYDVVYCGLRREHGNGFINRSEVLEPTEYTGNQINEVILDFIASKPDVTIERKYEMSVWHSIYSADIIRRNGLSFLSEREVGSEDLPFQLDVLEHSNKILFIPDVFYTYCLNEVSLTSTYFPEKYDRYKKLYQILQRKSRHLDPHNMRTNRFMIGYARSCVLNLICSDFSYLKSLRVLTGICNDPFWKDIPGNYPPKYLPLPQRIFYNLIIIRKIKTLYLYAKIFRFIQLFKERFLASKDR